MTDRQTDIQDLRIYATSRRIKKTLTFDQFMLQQLDIVTHSPTSSYAGVQ